MNRLTVHTNAGRIIPKLHTGAAQAWHASRHRALRSERRVPPCPAQGRLDVRARVHGLREPRLRGCAGTGAGADGRPGSAPPALAGAAADGRARAGAARLGAPPVAAAFAAPGLSYTVAVAYQQRSSVPAAALHVQQLLCALAGSTPSAPICSITMVDICL